MSPRRTVATSGRVLAQLRHDKRTVARARKIQKFLSQPFSVAETFTGSPGQYVKLADTVRGFGEILDGKHDEKPEQAYDMKGGIEQVQ